LSICIILGTVILSLGCTKQPKANTSYPDDIQKEKSENTQGTPEESSRSTSLTFGEKKDFLDEIDRQVKLRKTLPVSACRPWSNIDIDWVYGCKIMYSISISDMEKLFRLSQN